MLLADLILHRRRFSAVALIARLAEARALRRQRRALTRLDARLLRDIGLTRSEAVEEARRRLWDAPPHWRR